MRIDSKNLALTYNSVKVIDDNEVASKDCDL